MKTDYYYNTLSMNGIVETYEEMSRVYAEHIHYEIVNGNWDYPSLSSWLDECTNGYAKGLAHIAYFATYDLGKCDLADYEKYDDPYGVPYDGTNTTIVAVDDNEEVYPLDESVYKQCIEIPNSMKDDKLLWLYSEYVDPI